MTTMDPNDPDAPIDELLDRVEALLTFMTEAEAAQHLLDLGVAGEFVFLAIKAANVHPQPSPPR